ncbi:hypothetical protein EDB70_1149 [Vibrio crassostreae]|uniref:hypothetical protein n=1 Tax=Vibrio crassostreae TaxID=246167 RepID=UPI001043525A|nr:hypothetical protein [Vibrio crassostreae]TCV22097.1 hypothetical protein EDB70_1149 [Vibrio crassostreae]
MTESAVASIIISIMIFMMSTALVMVGWEVIYKNGKKIASRNEMFARKTAVMNELSALTNEAVSFWENDKLKDSECLIKTSIFVAKTQSIKNKVKLMQELGLVVDIDVHVRNLRRSITLDAEQANQVDLGSKCERIFKIIESSDSLKKQLSQAFMQGRKKESFFYSD